MSRAIRRRDFVDVVIGQGTVIDDVSRRNSNVITNAPISSGGSYVDTSQVINQQIAWVPVSFLQCIFTSYGAPLMLNARVRLSAITADTKLRVSFMIDGAEVTGTNYGLAEFDSLNFQPVYEITHMVTNVPAATHLVQVCATLVNSSGSRTATVYGGIRERLSVVEVK